MLTLDEWIALPEGSESWLELVGGALVATPWPRAMHQRAVSRLAYLLDDLLPDRFATVAQIEMVIAERPLPTVRVPDVVVVDTALLLTNPARCPAGEVRLVIEVSSEESTPTDRVIKFAEYAEAGIANYWIVDLTAPVSLTRYLLIDGEYALLGADRGLAGLLSSGA